MSDKKEKNPNAVALGRLGAKARQEKLTPEQRRTIAQNAIRARWAKTKKRRHESVFQPRENVRMSEQDPLNNSSARPPVGSPDRKRPVSERRIRANRRNALRSTGPVTEREKRTVARNAIKHGVLAREVVIRPGMAKRI